MEDDDEKVIPKTASNGCGEKPKSFADGQFAEVYKGMHLQLWFLRF